MVAGGRIVEEEMLAESEIVVEVDPTRCWIHLEEEDAMPVEEEVGTKTVEEVLVP